MVHHSPHGRPGFTIRRRVLVVDDNRDAADTLGILLEYLGADAHVVHSGEMALQCLSSFKPSAILLDLGMPGMDGIEVARRLRQEPEGREVVLIALTGWGQEDDRRRTKEAGFNHHLVKPIDLSVLQELLASVPPHVVEPRAKQEAEIN
jgi:CheY-like chemotaxis protein